jgi:hypothetical protein
MTPPLKHVTSTALLPVQLVHEVEFLYYNVLQLVATNATATISMH